MMKKRFLLLAASILGVALTVGLVPKMVNNNVNKADASPNYIYETDFTNLNVTGADGARVNEVTGYIHANDFSNTKTVNYKGSRWLDYKVPANDGYGYSTVGWIGGGGLSKLRRTEPYTCEMQIELSNMEHLIIEYVSDEWGAFNLAPDGTITNQGGGNITNVSYDTGSHILKFGFTAFFNNRDKTEGFIQLTGWQAQSSAKLYLKYVKIYHSAHVMDLDFNSLPTGPFNVNDNTKLSKFYIDDNYTSTVSSSIVSNGGNKSLQFTSTSNGGNIYLNKLNVMGEGRYYTITMKYASTNLKHLYLFYGHKYQGMTYQTYAAFDIAAGTVIEVHDGANCGFDASIDKANGLISFSFSYATVIPKPYEFLIDLDGEASGYTLSFSNVVIDVLPYSVNLEVNTSLFNSKINLGEHFDWTKLVVTAIYSDESALVIPYGSNGFSVEGVDENLVGEQNATIVFDKLSRSIVVEVMASTSGMIVDTSLVKTNIAYGEELDLSLLIVKISYGSKSQELIHCGSLNGYVLCYNNFDKYKPGTYPISVIYKEYNESFNVTVGEIDGVTFPDISYIPTV